MAKRRVTMIDFSPARSVHKAEEEVVADGDLATMSSRLKLDEADAQIYSSIGSQQPIRTVRKADASIWDSVMPNLPC